MFARVMTFIRPAEEAMMAVVARIAAPVEARRLERVAAADSLLGRGLVVAMAASLPIWAALAYVCCG
jgi:hypothetical protein